jgi:hypothetical protein
VPVERQPVVLFHEDVERSAETDFGNQFLGTNVCSRTGTDVMCLKIFSPKKLAFLSQKQS